MSENQGSEPLVSLCMPVFNEEKYIAEALDSIQKQTYRNIEVSIFDNRSTDATPDICRKFTADPRFRLHRNAVNVGHVNNFNRCIAGAGGSYLSLRSGNDVIGEGFVEKLLEPMLADSSVGLVYAKSKVIDEESNDVRSIPEEHYFETVSTDPVEAGTTVMKRFSISSPVFGLYRREVIERLQPFRFLYGSDAVFVCETALYASIKYVGDELYHRRQHGGRKLLIKLHSEDWVRGVPPKSLFSKLEFSTPFIDMLWSHLEMFGRAQVDEEQKVRLCDNAPPILRRRYGGKMEAAKRRLIEHANRYGSLYENPSRNVVRMIARSNLQDRVRRAMFAFPGDLELNALALMLARHTPEAARKAAIPS